MSRWPTITLGELTSHRPICYGVLKPGERQSPGVPLLRITDINQNVVDTSDIYEISPELSREFRRSVLKGDEVLLSIQGTVGRVALCPPEMAGANISRTIGLIDPDARMDRRFLRYWLLSMDGKFPVGGATRASLNIGDIRKLRAPVPPLEEQRRIVEVLDEAFPAIATATANAENNLANARELFASYLEACFADYADQAKVEPLERLCINERVITYGVIKLGEHDPNGVPCLRTSNVRWLDFDLIGMKNISLALSQEYRRTILQGGEVLVNVRGTLGGVAVASEAMVGWNVSREVAVVPCDAEKINPSYLAYWIGTRAGQEWLANVEKGVAYSGINIADLRTLPVPVIPPENQQRMVADLACFLSFARDLEAQFRKKIAMLTEFKQSLLRRAFSGELREREPLAA